MSDTLEKNTPLITELTAGATVGGFLQGYGPVPSVSGVNISAVGGGGGGSGLVTTPGLNGVSWVSSPVYSLNSVTQDTTVSIGPSVTKITTPLEVNGRDILKELDEMRDALLLLKRDIRMEEKYPKLKELKDAYERALEKYKTFDAIKDSK
jgi:hypothetical protein